MAAAAITVVALGGCANRTNAAGRTYAANRLGPAPLTPPAGARPSFPYALYTHCGINEANIAGRWYAADTRLSDGNDNPPPGWGNPYQPGIITIRSATHLFVTQRPPHARPPAASGYIASKRPCLPRPAANRSAPSRATARLA
jgi:hypothetical protein